MNQTPLSPADEPLPPPAPKRRPKTFKKVLASILSSTMFLFLVFPVVIATVLTAFIIQSYQVDGQSMETTLQNHDRLIVDKFPRTWAKITGKNFTPARGNIVVFNQTGLPDFYFQKQLIKRVIGLPGERVVVSGGVITVYNNQHPDGFNPDTSGLYKITAPTTSGEIDVNLDDNEIFVCGDNRNNSEDSRYFGPVNTKNLVGKLVLRILPIGKTTIF